MCPVNCIPRQKYCVNHRLQSYQQSTYNFNNVLKGSRYFTSTNSYTACPHDLSSTISRRIRNSNRKRNQPLYITIGWISPNSSAPSSHRYSELCSTQLDPARPSSHQLTSPHLTSINALLQAFSGRMYVHVCVSISTRRWCESSRIKRGACDDSLLDPLRCRLYGNRYLYFI
jgi:hypothetical protein